MLRAEDKRARLKGTYQTEQLHSTTFIQRQLGKGALSAALRAQSDGNSLLPLGLMRFSLDLKDRAFPSSRRGKTASPVLRE